MFSPYYARARRRGAGDPLAHTAMNVSLDGAHRRWAMTERPRAALVRTASTLGIGASRVHWDGEQMHWHVDERCAPLPRRVLGRVSVRPQLLPARRFALDPDGAHWWWPLAPRARVRVQLAEPALHWEGDAYLDCNWGTRPPGADFRGWSWSRAPLGEGARVYYEVQHRRASCAPLALQFDPAGATWQAPLLPEARLPRSGWGIARRTRSELPAGARIVRTLVDAPFYARTRAEVQLAGQRVPLVHERLDLDRLAMPVVQWMLPFRMPRWPAKARPAGGA